MVREKTEVMGFWDYRGVARICPPREASLSSSVAPSNTVVVVRPRASAEPPLFSHPFPYSTRSVLLLFFFLSLFSIPRARRIVPVVVVVVVVLVVFFCLSYSDSTLFPAKLPSPPDAKSSREVAGSCTTSDFDSSHPHHKQHRDAVHQWSDVVFVSESAETSPTLPTKYIYICI